MNSASAPFRTACGFSVIELMTSLTVAGVLMAIAVPSFREMTASNRLGSQSNEVIAALNFSRSEAIKRNTTISFCRAASEVAAKCETSAGKWEFWIVRTAGGTVIRRGAVPTYGNTLVVQSTLIDDQIAFASDGLARTGGALVTDRNISVCVSNVRAKNMRIIDLMAGSRVSTKPGSGDCDA